jgi:AcrR family transcriptional regulator
MFHGCCGVFASLLRPFVVTTFERAPSFSRRQWQLLDAAMRLLDRVGISGFTMRSLADEVNLSPMAAYKHFENQRALQIELWRHCQNQFYDQLLHATSEATDPASGFLTFCRTFVAYGVEFPYRYELLYNHPFVREIREIPEMEELRQSVWDYARDLVDRARDAGLFRADMSTDQLLNAAGSQIRGLASVLIYQQAALGPDTDEHAMIDSGMAFLREGLMAR